MMKVFLCLLAGLYLSPVVYADKPQPKKKVLHRKPSDNSSSLPEKFERGVYALTGKLTRNSQSHQTFIRLFPGTETEVAILLEGGIPVEESFLLDGSIYKIEVEFFKSATPANSVGFFVKAGEMLSPDDATTEVWKKLK